MKKLFMVAIIFSMPLQAAELIMAFVQQVIRQNVPAPVTPPFIYGEAVDANNTTAAKFGIRLCIDDTTWNCTSNNKVLITANTNIGGLNSGNQNSCATAFPSCAQWWWQIPSSAVGSVTPRDGNTHQLHVWVISNNGDTNGGKCGTGAGSCESDFSPIPFKWDAATSNLAEDYIPVLTSSTPATASQYGVMVDTSQNYSVGSAGATVCAGGSTLTGSTAVKDDGVAGYWIQKHGIPCNQVIEAAMGSSDAIQIGTFNTLWNTGLNALPSNVQYTVAAWAKPGTILGSGVTNFANCPNSNHNPTGKCYGLAGFLTMYGTTNGVEPTSTGCPAQTQITTPVQQNTNGVGQGPSNPWFNSGTDSTPFTTNLVRPSILLAAGVCATCTTGNNSQHDYAPDFTTMKNVIDAATTAIGTNPTGIAQTAMTANTRHVLALAFNPTLSGGVISGYLTNTLLGTLSPAATVTSNPTSGTATGNLAYFNGDALWNYTNISFLAGAGFGYSSTSNTGEWVSGGIGQSQYQSWLGSATGLGSVAGNYTGNPAVASMASAIEPCESLMMKFIRPELFLQYYTNGWNVLQAAWKAQFDPWNMNMTGDPFAQPYGSPVTFSGSVRGGPRKIAGPRVIQ